MTIGLKGTWSVSVKTKSAAWAQRFIIEGSDSGDGSYNGVVGNTVLVTGDQWGVTIENNPTGPISWQSSRARLANFRVDGGFFRVDIESDDGGGGPDEDFNDLILTASKPLSSSDWVVYGTAKTYKGFCRFNPCFPYPWIVVDTALQLERLLKYDQIRPIFEEAYGPDVASLAKREKFKPLVLSRGGTAAGGFAVRGKTEVEFKAKGKSKEKKLDVSRTAEAIVAQSPFYVANVTAADLAIIDRVIAFAPCEVEPIAEAIMRFIEYDRTDSELGGGSYTGFGDRETLGVSATDEFGNYVFSFARTTAQLVTEALEDTPEGADPTVTANPDLIIQFVEDPDGVAVYETAPYYDIPNIKRIDLCIPVAQMVPKPCRGDRVLQYLGDIPIINNPGSTLHSDGTITNTSASESGPAITRGAWHGTVDIRGCFEDSSSPVVHYTIRYQVGSGGFSYFTGPARGLRQQGNALWLSESYGPTDTNLSVGVVPAYRNIELEPRWSLEVQHRKAKVYLKAMLGDLDPAIEDVWFVIRGYDSNGNYVSGTYDWIKLRVDEEEAEGDIASIVVPGQPDPGDCALLELPNDNTPLAVRLRALDAEGFLAGWWLKAWKGSNNLVGLTDTATAAPPAGAYPGAVADWRYYGTSERGDADVEGYIVLNVTPPAGGWLEGEDFCAYSIELHLQDRTTNGKTVSGSHKEWDEVVGMRPVSP